ncbi:MAG TPA: hypothetical protein VLA19_19725 [Herpetosiphonaceae bacterium]|nr:hypothetical protein [Herpetosiphonaceae bacterium]
MRTTPHLQRRGHQLDQPLADLLHGQEVQMPPAHGTFKQAQRVQQPAGEQLGFEVNE